jgi:hypothetical protein
VNTFNTVNGATYSVPVRDVNMSRLAEHVTDAEYDSDGGERALMATEVNDDGLGFSGETDRACDAPGIFVARQSLS